MRIPQGPGIGVVRVPWAFVSYGVTPLIGVLFVFAALWKLSDPAAFMESVVSFEDFPAWIKVGIVVCVPGIELVGGMAILFRYLLLEALIICALLVITFILAGLYLIHMKATAHCGCFNPSIQWLNVSPKVHFALDLIILGCIAVSILVCHQNKLAAKRTFKD